MYHTLENNNASSHANLGDYVDSFELNNNPLFEQPVLSALCPASKDIQVVCYNRYKREKQREYFLLYTNKKNQ